MEAMRSLPPALKYSLIFFIALACLGGGYRLILLATGNFHTVVPGELYRAARPSPQELISYVKQHGIRTVLNLRGSNPQKRWYQQEESTAKELGLKLINLPLNSRHELNANEMDELISLMRNAPKPILIHCQAGADRSALASALYLFGIKHTSPQEADAQFSLLFGHLPFSFSKAYAMDRSFAAYTEHNAMLTKLAEK
jgi:protein tyrosine/serine phosphatase